MGLQWVCMCVSQVINANKIKLSYSDMHTNPTYIQHQTIEQNTYVYTGINQQVYILDLNALNVTATTAMTYVWSHVNTGLNWDNTRVSSHT